MSKPHTYPPVEGMSIRALEQLLAREKLKEAERLGEEYNSVEKLQKKVIEERGIPEFREKPRHPISYIAKQYYPHKELTERKQWLNGEDYLRLLFDGLWGSGTIAVWLIICLIAIFNF